MSKQVYLLRLRYMIFLRPHLTQMKLLLERGETVGKKRFPVALLDHVKKQIGLTDEEYQKVMSIQTEEDLNRLCGMNNSNWSVCFSSSFSQSVLHVKWTVGVTLLQAFLSFPFQPKWSLLLTVHLSRINYLRNSSSVRIVACIAYSCSSSRSFRSSKRRIL